MRTYLGLDSGGTKTAWALLDGAGACLGEGRGPGVQLVELGPAEAGARLRAQLRTILVDRPAPAAVVLAVAGAGSPAARQSLRDAVPDWPAPVCVTGDFVAAAAAALAEGPGACVWAGTGSFAVARSAAGQLHRVGGRGPWLSDDGSAYELVREAARAAVRALDQLGPPTELTDVLPAEFRVTDPLRLGVALQRVPSAELAAALPVVIRTAERGDAVAAELLATGGRRLAGLALGAARTAGLEPAQLAVSFGGSVLQHVAGVRESFTRALAEAGVAAPPVPVARSAAAGAALLARAVAQREQPLAGWLDA